MEDQKGQLVIGHFSHMHPLKLLKRAIEDTSIIFCGMCQEEIVLDMMYNCRMCSYSVHISCTKFPRQIEHSFHPHHSLILHNYDLSGAGAGPSYSYSCSKSKIFQITRKEELDLWSYLKVRSLGASSRNEDEARELVHQLADCECHIQLRYAALVPSDKHQNLAVQIYHEHPLIVSEKPKEYQYSCSRCGEPFDNDLIYVCLECKCLLHESCIALSNEIKHAFHPEHVLTLVYRDVEGFFKCDLCANHGYAHLYRCLKCNFTIDLFCANLVPTTKDFVSDQRKEIQLNHPHPLIQCNSIKDIRHPCFACGLFFYQDYIYVCLHCGILLHKSCADMPGEIVHTFHPQHPLTIHMISPICRWPYCSSTCRGCRKGTGSFVYICQDCEFFLDIKCVVAKLPIVTTDAHQHSLAFFNIRTQAFRCNICYSSCDEFFFRCVKCNYNIHAHCHPLLPETIKHDCHCDPLTLTRTPIKDLPDEADDAEFYCNACEELRDLNHPSYYCASCHFVAHVRCVISEIITYMQSEALEYEGIDFNFKLETSMSIGIDNDESIPESGSSEEARDSTMEDIVHDVDGQIEAPKRTIHDVNEEIEALQEKVDVLTTKLSLLLYDRSQIFANYYG